MEQEASAVEPLYSPEAMLEIITATRHAVAVTRSSVGESRQIVRQTHRRLKETYQRLQDSIVLLSGKDESFRRLTGFLSGGKVRGS